MAYRGVKVQRCRPLWAFLRTLPRSKRLKRRSGRAKSGHVLIVLIRWGTWGARNFGRHRDRHKKPALKWALSVVGTGVDPVTSRFSGRFLVYMRQLLRQEGHLKKPARHGNPLLLCEPIASVVSLC